MITRHTEGKRFLVIKNMAYSHVSNKTCSLKVNLKCIQSVLCNSFHCERVQIRRSYIRILNITS